MKRELFFPILVYILVICLAFVSTNFAAIGYIALSLEERFVRRKKSDPEAKAEETSEVLPERAE